VYPAEIPELIILAAFGNSVMQNTTTIDADYFITGMRWLFPQSNYWIFLGVHLGMLIARKLAAVYDAWN